MISVRHVYIQSQPFVSSFSSCGLLKDSKASGLKWREHRSGSLGSFIHPQASSHFSPLLIARKAVKSYIASLVPFDWKWQPKATQNGLVSVFYFLSCVAVKSTSSSPNATIGRHRCRMYCAYKIMAPKPKTMLIFSNNIHFHGFSTTYLNKIRYIKLYMS